MSSKPRRIVVDGETYLWRYVSRHVPGDAADRFGQHHDTFTVWTGDRSRPSLRVHFVTRDDWRMGAPLNNETPLVEGQPDTGGINLNRPLFAAHLIRQARLRGWTPGERAATFTIDDGLDLLTAAGYTVG